VDTAKAGRFSRYLSDTVDPRELKRQIRFKEQVVRSLRESSDREITLLENEIGDLQKALIARAKPPTLSPASGKPSSPSELKPGQKLRGLSLYDDYLDCIEISREAQAARLRQRSGVLDSGDARADEGRQYSMSVPGEREWWRDRSIVEKRAISYTRFAAYAGIFGVCCSLAQNELILHETEPHAPEIDALKMLNSAATLLCILCIYRNYWLCTLVYRINRHCRRMTPLNANITVMDVMSQPSFWIEAFVVAIHCPPFYTDEYSTYSFDNIVVYRWASFPREREDMGSGQRSGEPGRGLATQVWSYSNTKRSQWELHSDVSPSQGRDSRRTCKYRSDLPALAVV